MSLCAVRVDLQNAPGIQTGAAIITFVDECVRFRDEPPLLPGTELVEAHRAADRKDQDDPDRPEDDLQERALDFVVRMFQVG